MLFLNFLNYSMPALGLGTWLINTEKLEKSLDYALEIGYRHIDTALLYDNEKTIGKVLEKWLKSGKIKRENLFITTKLPPIGNYPERVEKYIKTSLENLKLDYVDLYLIHSPEGIKNPPMENNNGCKNIEMDVNVDLNALWKKLEEQVAIGRTKSIGVSNFNKENLEQIIKNCTIKPACNQIELNVYVQQKILVDYCKKNDIKLVGYCPLGSPGINEFYMEYGIKKTVPNLLEDPVIKKIAGKYSKTPAQIALRFLIEQNVGAVPKSSNFKRIKENYEIFDFSLIPEDMEQLKGLDKGKKIHGNWESWTWLEEEGTIKSKN